MKKSFLIITAILFLILSSNLIYAFPIKSRVRIINVDIAPDIIKIEDSFHISIDITKQRYRKFDGEIHIYLTNVGLIREKIGECKFFTIPKGKQNFSDIQIICDVSKVEADWFQESYGIQIILYEKWFGYLIQKDAYSIESISVISKFWDKDKLKISSFQPPDEWKTEQEIQGLRVKPNDAVVVQVTNDGYYKYSITVCVFIVEKTSMGVPLIEGFGEYKKEIGRETLEVFPDNKPKRFNVSCILKPADQEKISKSRKFDVQAVVFADVDGTLYQVDVSSIQTISVPVGNAVDWLLVNGPWIWIIFVAGIGTILLVVVTIKYIIPTSKLKGEEALEKLERFKKRKNK